MGGDRRWWANPVEQLRRVNGARRGAPAWRAAPAQPDTFAARLNRLFDVVYPPGRGPYRNSEVIQALADRGYTLSAPYLSQLRTGQRTGPSAEMIGQISAFFGIRPEYFAEEDNDYTKKLDSELRWCQIARDDNVRRVVTALLALPPADREVLLDAHAP